MKFNFKIQQYQTDAVKAVVDVFKGQPFEDKFSYRRDLGDSKKLEQYMLTATDSELEAGFKNNEIRIDDNDIFKNIKSIQQDNNIKLAPALVKEKGLGSCILDVEMETGTGKTYVYIKTMFELNRQYGWSKFIIVVPSIAIREGVKKSFEIMEEHFFETYSKKARFFIYSSSNLTKLDDFSSDNSINVMIINTHAFAKSFEKKMNKDGTEKTNSVSRIIYDKRDEFQSRKPIEVIAANNPILILDEPQKMGGEATQKALKNFNPLFVLNYSATHKKNNNLVYVLDALEAYNQKLVKKIEVKGFELKNLQGTNSYLYVDSIERDSKKPPFAKVEMEIAYKSNIKRELRTLNVGDDLYYISNNMEQYKGFNVSEINPLSSTISFTNGEVVEIGDIIGDKSEEYMRRVQIRETIASHFEKEEKLYNMGIKTLSLFFIDEVAKYRLYDENNDELLGEYGKIFEEEYNNICSEKMSLFDTGYQNYLRDIATTSTHKGYFSIDKKTGKSIDSEIKRGSEFSDDISAYDLILKNKERLLDLNEPTRFIFSHSALREGWDNPNVFQICTLKHSDSKVAKRQEVGRGLRLCVDKTGNRMDAKYLGETVHDINLLTVIASESYKDFVTDLQSDIKKNLYDRPTKATIEYFEGKRVTLPNGEHHILDAKEAKKIYNYLVRNDYINDDDVVTDKYKTDIALNTIAPLPDELQSITTDVHTLVKAIFDESALGDYVEDGNKAKIRSNPLNKNFYREEFQALWKSINHKYAYTVEFDSNELIAKAIKSIDSELYVSTLGYTISKGQQTAQMNEHELARSASFENSINTNKKLSVDEVSTIEYDLIGKIALNTTLTRKTTRAILTGMSKEKFSYYAVNPEEFITKVSKIIQEQKATTIVDHITYNQIDGTFDNSIFTQDKPTQAFDKAYLAERHIQDYVFTDGTAEQSIERKFAEKLDTSDEVHIFAKLPRGFYIPTPLGNYSPDWAIAFKEGTVKHIFFVAETKGSMETLNLREIEKGKIACAKKLFNEMSTSNVKYAHVDSYENLLNIMNGI